MKPTIPFRPALILLALGFLAGRVHAQVSVKDSAIATPMIFAAGGYQLPGVDMADRFGANANIGGGFLQKLKSGLLVGADGAFMFSDRVRETNILDNISTPPDDNGIRHIIDGNGTYSEIFMYERGFILSARVGYLYPCLGPNKNSGLVALAGIGFMQHKIRIENKDNDTPQLAGDLVKGYDRLSNGRMFNQFIGYMNLSNNHLVNFFAGLEVTEGFTRNRRSVNYDTGKHDGTKRLDMLYGLRFGWVLPLYSRAPEKVYYY